MTNSNHQISSDEFVDKTLQRHSLKKTQLRKNILLVLSQSKAPLSQASLISALSEELHSVDRVSVYRNLNQLKDLGIVHEVDVNSYVFCSHECESHAHLLLFCQKCHRHQEIKDHKRIESFMSALGHLQFFSNNEPIFLRGVCTRCPN